jgi:hypothetical protein
MCLEIGYNADIPMDTNIISPNLLYFVTGKGELVFRSKFIVVEKINWQWYYPTNFVPKEINRPLLCRPIY